MARPNRASTGTRTRCWPRETAGFTLVELLIALAMVGLITLLLFSGLRLGTRAWDGVDAVSERTGAVRLAHDFLARTLSQSRPISLVVEAANVAIFAGTEDALEFAAPLSEFVGVPGIYVLRLSLEGRGESRDLVLTRWLNHPQVLEGGEGIPAWEPLAADTAMELASVDLESDAAAGAFGRTRLLAGVEVFEISYFGIVEGETEADWQTEWLEQPTPPSLVRIRLGTLEQSWPDLIVALPGARV